MNVEMIFGYLFVICGGDVGVNVILVRSGSVVIVICKR